MRKSTLLKGASLLGQMEARGVEPLSPAFSAVLSIVTLSREALLGKASRDFICYHVPQEVKLSYIKFYSWSSMWLQESDRKAAQRLV